MLKTKKPTNRPFLTIPEVAEEYSFPVATVRSLVKQEAFPVMKVRSATYVMREAFEAYLTSVGSMASVGSPSSTPTSLTLGGEGVNDDSADAERGGGV